MKKQLALITSVALLATMANSVAWAADGEADVEYTQFPLTMECEDMEGATLWTDIYGQQFPGYSGSGFAYLIGDTMSLTVTVPEDAMYEISVRYIETLDKAGREQTIAINGVETMKKVTYADEWSTYDFGMFRLKAGENTISLIPKYGYAGYDTITIKEADFPSLDVEPALADKNATSETQALMNYLTDVYGKHTISGQQEIYGGGNDGDYELEFNYIKNLTGKLPAIRGFDFMNYNPLYGWDDKTTERIIDWVNTRGGIATACWHINVPLDFENYTLGDALDWQKCTYTEKTSFNAANATVEGTKEYDYVTLAIEDLAEQLQRLQDAHVPIILRPFHEAEGNGGLDGKGAWFWWSAAGADAYVKLWHRLYDTLTNEYGLHNIIWEQNLYCWSDDSAKWYAGDDYVDIVGYDKYNTVYNRHDGKTSGPNEDAESGLFYNLLKYVNGKKMVSMPENDTIPSLANIKVEHADWLYFCPWYGEHILDSSKNNPDTVKEMYQSDYCITLDELPTDLKTYGLDVDPTVTTTTGAVTTTTTTTTATGITSNVETTTAVATTTTVAPATTTAVATTTKEGESTTTNGGSTNALYGDVNLDGSVTLADLVTFQKQQRGALDFNAQQEANANCETTDTPDSVDAADLRALLDFLIGRSNQLPV